MISQIKIAYFGVNYNLYTQKVVKNALLLWKSHVYYFRKLQKFPTMFYEKLLFLFDNCKNNLIRKKGIDQENARS